MTKVAAIPVTVMPAAVKACNPPSIAQADIPLASGTVGLDSDTRSPSPSSFPATPSCPAASEISCTPILRDQESPLISHLNVFRQAHVFMN
jgi:hypothetical protein